MNSHKLIRFIFKSGSLNSRTGITSSVVHQTTLRNMSSDVTMPQSAKEKQSFQDELPGVMNTIITNPKLAEIPDVSKWIKKILEYNLSGGKKFRGLTTVLAYEMFEKSEKITEEKLKLARILGWCAEMLQGYLVVLDDIMDGSSRRRGVPCWYKVPGVGLGAINDSILIYSSIFHILKTYFGNRPEYYINLMELFNETLFNTSIGQNLDFMTAHQNNKNYSLFTIDRYNAIVKHKTAYYTYKLPVSLGLFLADNTDKEIHNEAEKICIEIGNFFQIQDDYIDCFGDEKLTGKVGTDIQEGKCTWLAVTALERCSDTQRNVFVACYGSQEPAHVERIKRLYEQLELPRLYAERERDHYNEIVRRVQTLPAELTPALFYKLIDMIYKRKY